MYVCVYIYVHWATYQYNDFHPLIHIQVIHIMFSFLMDLYGSPKEWFWIDVKNSLPWNKDVLAELPFAFTIIYRDVAMWGCCDSRDSGEPLPLTTMCITLTMAQMEPVPRTWIFFKGTKLISMKCWWCSQHVHTSLK